MFLSINSVAGDQMVVTYVSRDISNLNIKKNTVECHVSNVSDHD